MTRNWRAHSQPGSERPLLPDQDLIPQTGPCRRAASTSEAYDPKVTRISIPSGEGEELYRLWAMNPELAGPAGALSAAVYASNLVSFRTRELMRKRIAEINACDI
jgi:hypothetical protein